MGGKVGNVIFFVIFFPFRFVLVDVFLFFLFCIEHIEVVAS